MSNNINPKVKVDSTIVVHFELTESSARALHDLTSYGAEVFFDKFCKEMGSHYLTKNKAGFIALWESLRIELPRCFAKIDKIKKLQQEIVDISLK